MMTGPLKYSRSLADPQLLWKVGVVILAHVDDVMVACSRLGSRDEASRAVDNSIAHIAVLENLDFQCLGVLLIPRSRSSSDPDSGSVGL